MLEVLRELEQRKAVFRSGRVRGGHGPAADMVAIVRGLVGVGALRVQRCAQHKDVVLVHHAFRETGPRGQRECVTGYHHARLAAEIPRLLLLYQKRLAIGDTRGLASLEIMLKSGVLAAELFAFEHRFSREEQHVQIVALAASEQDFESAVDQLVIGVEEIEVVPLRVVHARIARGTRPAVLLRDEGEVRKFVLPRATDLY